MAARHGVMTLFLLDYRDFHLIGGGKGRGNMEVGSERKEDLIDSGFVFSGQQMELSWHSQPADVIISPGSQTEERHPRT